MGHRQLGEMKLVTVSIMRLIHVRTIMIRITIAPIGMRKIQALGRFNAGEVADPGDGS